MNTIFVSSTFRDMNQERDAIQTLVVPELNEIARKYGTSVGVMDLRWGVDTSTLESEEGSRKVLSVCLDEIDNCRPYMIVLLGERYGWIPSKELIEEAVNNRTDFSLSQLEKSVTALEIEYGALRNSDQLENTLFYFREVTGNPPIDYLSEGSDHAAKLAELKQRIIKATHGRVKTYKAYWDDKNQCLTGMDAFAKMVTFDIRSLMEPQWKKMDKLTLYQRDLLGQWDFARQKASQFTGRQYLVSSCLDCLESGTNVLAIQGASGCGKSTLISKLAFDIQKQGKNVLPVFCGNSALTGSTMAIVQYLVEYLEDNLEFSHMRPESDRVFAGDVHQQVSHFEDLVAAYNQQADKSLVVLIDAVDQLTADQFRETLCFIPSNVSEKFQVVLSCLDEFKINHPIKVFQIPFIPKENRKEILAGILDAEHKGVDRNVMNAMIRKKGANNPLYLSLLVQRLQMMDLSDFKTIYAHGNGNDDIAAHQLQIIKKCAPDVDGLCIEILNQAARKVGYDSRKLLRLTNDFKELIREFLAEKDIRSACSAALNIIETKINYAILRILGGQKYVLTYNTSPAFIAMAFLSVSRYGLREQDLEGVFHHLGIPWSTLNFARLRKYMHRFFVQREDGCIDFSHRAFRKGIQMRIGNLPFYHRMLLEYLQTLDAHDLLRVREISYHCICADDKHFFVQYAQEHCDDEAVLAHCTRDLSGICQKDNGIWVCALLRKGEYLGADSRLVMVINRAMTKELPPTLDNLKLAERVLKQNKDFAEQQGSDDNTQSQGALVWCSYALGTICCKLGSSTDLERAAGYLTSGLEMCQELDRKGDSFAQELLALIYTQLGNLYLLRQNESDLNSAEKAYNNCIALYEKIAARENTPENQIKVTNSRVRLADVYNVYFKHCGIETHLSAAIAIYQSAIDYYVTQITQNPCDENVKHLCSIYLKAAQLYSYFDRQKAVDLCWLVLNDLGSLSGRENMLEKLRISAAAYEQMGDVLKEDDGSRSLTMYRKVRAIRTELADALRTVESYNELINLLRKMVESPSIEADESSELIRQVLAVHKETRADEVLMNMKKMLWANREREARLKEEIKALLKN